MKLYMIKLLPKKILLQIGVLIKKILILDKCLAYDNNSEYIKIFLRIQNKIIHLLLAKEEIKLIDEVNYFLNY